MTNARATTKRTWAFGLAAIATLSVLLHLPGLREGPTLDAAVFTVVADGLLHSALPYRDLWDHKPPGIYVLFAAAQAALPFVDPWVAVWVASVTTTAGIGLVVMFIVAPRGAMTSLAWALVTIFYVGVYPIALGGGQTEPPAALLALAALAAAFARRPMLAGLLLGAGAVMSLQVVPAGIGILAAAAAAELPGGKARSILWYVGGAFVVPALAVVAILALGLVEWAVSALVVYNSAYAAVNRGRPFPLFVLDAVVMLLFAAPLLMLALPAAIRAPRGSGRAMAVGAVLWLAGWVLFVVLQARLEPHYFVAAAPAIVLLASHARLREVSRGRAGVATGVALVTVAIAVAAIGLAPLAARPSAAANDDRLAAAAVVLQDGATAGGTLFVWGNEPELYLASDLRPAAPYVYVYPLTTPGYADAARIDDLVHQLERAHPAYIVDAGSAAPGEPGIVPLLVPRPVVPADGRTADVIDPLRAFVREHYGAPIDAGGWLLYPATSW